MPGEKLKFIEETALMFEQMGMPRMAGRVFGYLIVCDEDAVSFDRIKEVLNASKGSISSTTRQLVQIGFIEPLSLPGDRKTYYRITKMELGRLLKNRMELFSKFALTLDKGRKLKNREDDTSQWLQEASVFYSWIGGEMDQTMDKWAKEKEQIIHQNRKGTEKL